MFKKVSLFVLTAIFVLMGSVALAAPEFITSDNGLVNLSDVSSDDTYVAGSKVVIDEDVEGDLWVAGSLIDINANVVGDLTVLGGGSVIVRGNIGDDLRAASADIVIEGQVGDDLLVGTGILTITESAVINGDLIAGGADMKIDGAVLGNVKAIFNRGVINNQIGGYANLKFDEGLQFGESAKIDGPLTYWAPQASGDFDLVASSVDYREWTSQSSWANSTWPAVGVLGLMIPSVAFGAVVIKYLGLLLLGGLLIWFMPKYLPKVATKIKSDFWSSLWQGFVLLVAVPAAAFVILMTVIGLPLSVVLMLSYAILLILAQVVIAMFIGSYFIKVSTRNKKGHFTALALGAAIYVLLVLIPVVGSLFKFVLLLLALGGIWRDSYALVKAGKY